MMVSHGHFFCRSMDSAWWENPAPPTSTRKWETLAHNGVLFPPAYEPHGVKMLYDGVPITLTPEQEEVATMYSRYLLTDHVKKPVFNDNFFRGFLSVLGRDHVIKEFPKCDFQPIHIYLQQQKEIRLNRTKEEKAQEKQEKQEYKEEFGFAVIDGKPRFLFLLPHLFFTQNAQQCSVLSFEAE